MSYLKQIDISDGGNSITVDGTVTVQDGGSSLTIDGEVSVEMPTALRYGKKVVAAAATAEVLGSSAELVSGIRIKASSTNTDIVYIGDSSVTADNGYPLVASESIFVSIDNVNKIYIKVSVDGESVNYIGS